MDMEFKGTKGDWVIKIARESNGFVNVETSNLGFTVWGEVSKRGCPGSEALANAKLISKAPEMLNMLSSVMDLLEAYPSESEMHVKATEIRRLIKKATTI